MSVMKSMVFATVVSTMGLVLNASAQAARTTAAPPKPTTVVSLPPATVTTPAPPVKVVVDRTQPSGTGSGTAYVAPPATPPTSGTTVVINTCASGNASRC